MENKKAALKIKLDSTQKEALVIAKLLAKHGYDIVLNDNEADFFIVDKNKYFSKFFIELSTNIGALNFNDVYYFKKTRNNVIVNYENKVDYVSSDVIKSFSKFKEDIVQISCLLYININKIKSIRRIGNSKTSVELINGIVLKSTRNYYKALLFLFNLN